MFDTKVWCVGGFLESNTFEEVREAGLAEGEVKPKRVHGKCCGNSEAEMAFRVVLRCNWGTVPLDFCTDYLDRLPWERDVTLD